MANRKTTEKVTFNPHYHEGFLAGVIGRGWTLNPYAHNSFEWLSWDAGWHKGRWHYLDEGWVNS